MPETGFEPVLIVVCSHAHSQVLALGLKVLPRHIESLIFCQAMAKAIQP